MTSGQSRTLQRRKLQGLPGESLLDAGVASLPHLLRFLRFLRSFAAIDLFKAAAITSSNEYAFDAAGVGGLHVGRQPFLAEHMPRDFDHDVISLRIRIVVVALQALQARRA